MKDISFTSASVFPAKLLHRNVVCDGKIMPVHLQISLTNKCTLHCSFCSCSERDKKLELSFEDIETIMTNAVKAGTKAVTITGGGEPLCHPRFKDIFEMIHSLGVKIGLVTNGTLVHKLDTEDLNRITWCRISSADFRKWNDKYAGKIASAVKLGPNVDWAFSHVVSRNPNYTMIRKVIDFANKHNFTHT